MPIKLENPHATLPNPQGIDGIRFCEVCGSSPEYYADLFGKIGMEVVATGAQGKLIAHKQGDALFIENHSHGTYAEQYAAEHGPCISALGFGVRDPEATVQIAVKAGAKILEIPDKQKLFDVPTLEGIGGSALYLIPLDQEAQLYKQVFGVDLTKVKPEGIGFYDIDHITHNVAEGNIAKWVNFYGQIFGFKPVFEVDEYTRLGKLTSMKTVAIMSPCKRFRIAVNEATESKSQIQQFIDQLGAEGVQHLALSSSNLYETVEKIADRNFPFQLTPKSYYEMLPERMQNHGENLERLERLGMLLDGENLGTDDEPDWKILLQIFSRNVIGPAFFEFIQRKGNEGFGDNNAQALFESIEREQQRHGYLG